MNLTCVSRICLCVVEWLYQLQCFCFRNTSNKWYQNDLILTSDIRAIWCPACIFAPHIENHNPFYQGESIHFFLYFCKINVLHQTKKEIWAAWKIITNFLRIINFSYCTNARLFIWRIFQWKFFTLKIPGACKKLSRNFFR